MGAGYLWNANEDDWFYKVLTADLKVKVLVSTDLASLSNKIKRHTPFTTLTELFSIPISAILLK